jgi:2-phosphosulfolactate phosphatase
MKIDVQLMPVSPDPSYLAERAVVVFDVLRATSVMVYAFSQGAEEILPVTKVEEAFQRARLSPAGTFLLGGERGSRRIEGFDLGNSPREYEPEKVRGKRLIVTTTNGTKAFHRVASGWEVMAGSFFNLGALAERCLRLGMDLFLFPSGDQGGFSLEDTVCAGMLIDRLIKTGQREIVFTDAAACSLLLFQRFEKNLVEAFYLSNHGRDLAKLGLEEDLAFCAQTDLTRVVPVFKDGILRAAE